MIGMQVNGRAQAQMTTVQQGSGQAQPSQKLSPDATATQAAEGVEVNRGGKGKGKGAGQAQPSQVPSGTQAGEGVQLRTDSAVRGGGKGKGAGQAQPGQQAPGATPTPTGAEVEGGGGKGKGKGAGKGKGKGNGGAGFQLPPGLEGRPYEQLPPGIRKKLAPPQMAPRQGGHGMQSPSKPTSGVDGAAGAPPAKAAGKPAADDGKMEQYLSDLSAGKVTKDQEPAGFREWAKQQMLEGAATEPAKSAPAQSAPAQSAPAQSSPPAPAATAGNVSLSMRSVAPTQA